MNFPRQTEPFGINIVHFGGLNWCQQLVSFLPQKSDNLFFLSIK